jgi:tetratricopeptide (TPR) repeat protein
LAKQQRGAPPRSVKKKATARKGAAPRSARGPATKVKGRPPARPAARRTAAKPPAKPVKLLKPGKAAKASVAPVQPAAPAPPPVAPRKPGFYEAVAIYERGVQALQRHDYVTGAELFRTVIDKYPEERELVERARVFVRVCERETARQAPPPETARDFVYAATVALNAGDHAGALGHLQRAISADDEDDHAHYTMAAALSLRGRSEEAIRHLQRSIALNPENRSQARQDPDLDSIRQLPGFRMALETAPAQRRKAVAARRR